LRLKSFNVLLARMATLVSMAAAAALVSACRQDMHDAPRYEPLEASTFFTDGQASRTLVANTVARGQLREDEHLYTGKVGGQLATEFPMPVTAETMARGQERFNVFCSPCHGRTGDGTGMIVQRGFRQPPSYYEDRLVNAPVGYLFDVMTNGFGAMQDYSAQVPVADRWAIAAYIRALQFSRRGTVNDVPADRREELDRSPVTPPPPPPPAAAGTAPGQPAAAAQGQGGGPAQGGAPAQGSAPAQRPAQENR
jgi:mono/diheme cytochrome c family protein